MGGSDLRLRGAIAGGGERGDSRWSGVIRGYGELLQVERINRVIVDGMEGEQSDVLSNLAMA